MYNVSGGPKIATSHSKRLSSFTSFTQKPSTGSSCRLLYSTANALRALLVDLVLAITSHNHYDCPLNLMGKKKLLILQTTWPRRHSCSRTKINLMHRKMTDRRILVVVDFAYILFTEPLKR